MEKYDNRFSRNEKSLGIFEIQELQNDSDNINGLLWLWYIPQRAKKKKYNLSECETTNLMLLQRTTLHGNYHKKDF